jgi:D-arabinose 1-dehydrogenase-like Zn-dependent alcohol dehydrogenase
MELRLQLQGVQLKDKWDFLQAAKGTMHGIMNTASASMSMYPYFALLKPQGKMILLGLPEKPLQISAFSLVTGKSVSEFCLVQFVQRSLQIFNKFAHGGEWSNVTLRIYQSTTMVVNAEDCCDNLCTQAARLWLGAAWGASRTHRR